jgi:hypothetical protein
MEEVVKLKEVVAAAMAALLMDASEKAVGEEGKPPEEWMADDVSSSERLYYVWICLVCWWLTENPILNGCLTAPLQ